jgi:hypothetical protein
MTLTVNDIIVDAYEVLGVMPSDNYYTQKQMEDGLKLLNYKISLYNASPKAVAYDSILNFNMVVGKMKYVIGNVAGVDPNTVYIINNPPISVKFIDLLKDYIQYPIELTTDTQYYNMMRPTNLSGIPDKAYCQRLLGDQLGSMFVHFFRAPQFAYVVTLKGKFKLSPLLMNAALTSMPDYMQTFLIYETAQQLYFRNRSGNWDEKTAEAHAEVKNVVYGSNDDDLSIETGNPLANVPQSQYNFWNS